MSGKNMKLVDEARQHMVGIENVTLPSFTPDLKSLDEEGIRWDVRQAKRHGFFCTFCATESGLTFDEAKRFVEVVVDEARNDILVSSFVAFESIDDNIDFLKHLARIGAHSALLSFPTNYYARSVEQAYQDYRDMCDAVPDFSIVLYPTHKYNLERFHPSGFPLELLDRWADIPNAVALKIGILEPGFLFEAFRRIGSKVLLSCPMERFLPLLQQQYGMQFIGAGHYEGFQSPEKPYLVDYFKLLRKGEIDKAMDIFWKLTPVRMVFEKQFMPTIHVGTYHFPQQKYYQWLVGGNGGFTRQPSMKMYQHEMEEYKGALRAIGITPREPDEEYYVGRVNYAKMKKA